MKDLWWYVVEICYSFKMVHDKRQHFGLRSTPLIINKKKNEKKKLRTNIQTGKHAAAVE